MAIPVLYDILLTVPGHKDAKRNILPRNILSAVLTLMFAVKSEDEEDEEEDSGDEDEAEGTMGQLESKKGETQM